MSGRALEAAGDLGAAVDAYEAERDFVNAARIAMDAGDQARAGLLLLRSIEGRDLDRLSPTGRQHAFTAALCLGAAGRVSEAAEILIALGEPGRAAELLEDAGREQEAERIRQRSAGQVDTDQQRAFAEATKHEREGRLQAALQGYSKAGAHGPAGRVAERLGRSEEAIELYERAGWYFRAALTYQKAGNAQFEWQCLLRIGPADPHYSDAVAVAIERAPLQPALDFRFEQFISAFIKEPKSDRDRDLLFALASVYERFGIGEQAGEVYEAILSRDPEDRLAKEKRQKVSSRTSIPEAKPLPGLPPAPVLAGLGRKERAPSSAPPRKIEAKPKASSKRIVDGSGLSEGTLVTERYHVRKLIGRGGMASVYVADDLTERRPIALKVFSRSLDADAEGMLERFKREIDITKKIDHPNVVRVFDIGEHSGHWFISFELLTGADLKRHMKKALPPELGLDFLAQAAAGLAAAHEQGIVHRDVKPNNLFLTKEGVIKVMDFGIAKSLGDTGHTMTGLVAGTPKYMSPEQISGFSKVTPQADVYSLGIVAFEMFTGRVPFSHADTLPILMMHLTKAPPPLRTIEPSVPEAVELLVLSMLCKKPEGRIQGAREVLRRARELMRGLG